jgi:hypothetical protein
MLVTLLLSAPTAANISAVAGLPADVADRDASFASAVLLTLLLAMLLLPLAFFISELCCGTCCYWRPKFRSFVNIHCTVVSTILGFCCCPHPLIFQCSLVLL